MKFIKRLIRAVLQILLLTLIGLIGTVITVTLHIPIPGSLLGMFLLFGLLITKVIKLEWVELGASLLIADLLLFFIPSASGIIQYGSLWGKTGALLVTVVIISIFMVLFTILFSTQLTVQAKRKGYMKYLRFKDLLHMVHIK